MTVHTLRTLMKFAGAVGAVAGIAFFSPSAEASTITETISFNNLANPGATTVGEGSNLNFNYSTNLGGDTQALVNAGTAQNPLWVLEDGNNTNWNGSAGQLSMVGGGSFSVLSMEIANFGGNWGGGAGGLSGFGWRVGLDSNKWPNVTLDTASTSFQSFDLSSYAGLQDITSLFTNIVSNVYAGNNFAIENVTVQYEAAVPEPAALSLLGFGLAGLWRMRRPRSA